MVILLFLTALLPLHAQNRWGGFEVDSTLWGWGLPRNVIDGYVIPGDSTATAPLEFSFVATDTAFINENGSLVTFNGFFISCTEITQHQWELVMGPHKWTVKDDNLPATGITPEEATKFCSRLDSIYKNKIHIPSLQEWRFAAQGGHFSNDYAYCGSNTLDFVAWYPSNSNGKIHPVAQKVPNELNLFDMNGNAREWVCIDSTHFATIGGSCWYTPLKYSDDNGNYTTSLLTPYQYDDLLNDVGFRVCFPHEHRYMDTGI